MRLPAAILLLTAAVTPLSAQSDSTWRDHDRAADAATAAADWSGAQRHLRAMDDLLGGYPSVAVALARVALRLGDTAEAIRQLGRVAAMGVVSRGLADTAFDGLRALPAFQAAAAAVAANAGTIGAATAWAMLPDSAAIAEDLAWDAARRRFVVSDVRGRRLWSVGLDARALRFGDPLPPGWGILGLAVDGRRGVLWATAVTLPQASGYTSADSGRSAILELDLASGAVRRRFDLPAPSRAAPGDVALAENGDLFAGDGQTGAVYVIRSGAAALELLVPAGRLRGTQQPAVAGDHRTLFIADYGRGIARVDRASGAVEWLARPDSITLTGIDGLVMRGDDLIAVQNGVTPNRIVLLALDGSGRRVLGARILLRDPALADDPTHVVVVGDALYAIGSAGWFKYGDDGAPRPGVPFTVPRLLRLDLR